MNFLPLTSQFTTYADSAKPISFWGGAQGGASGGLLGSQTLATTTATTTPKLDLLKVDKNPELNKTLSEMLADLRKSRGEQDQALGDFTRMNASLFNPNFLAQERAKLDLTPITQNLARNTADYSQAVNEGLGLALNRAQRNSNLASLNQTAGGGSMGDSSFNRLQQGQMFQEAATPFLGAVADRNRANNMWLEQLKQSQAGRDLALTQSYLNQTMLPQQLRAQMAQQQAGLLGNLGSIYNASNFLGVGGENPMSSPFVGQTPYVPSYNSPAPARRPSPSDQPANQDWLPEWMKRPPSGITTNAPRTTPARYTPDQLYQDSQGVWRVLPEYGGDQSWYDWTALGGGAQPAPVYGDADYFE